ncbi:oxidoreductase-like protein [Byssothecium circinans]|uniref:Oxidoreductase-like protein n=1 Tax=Byssothecium circinans TaxID=147558 RepID=A0A6A5TXQ0_9PLEO|nr:oxidoreductase-like protein [Byssothecium circinans]
MKAIKILHNHTAEVQETSIPKVRDDCVLVRVKAVAVNPSDAKHIDRLGSGGETVGIDLCGTIEEVGRNVGRPWKKGDRIATLSHGGNADRHEDGAFGEYALSKGDLGLRVPSSLSDTEAAALPQAVNTCGQGLYQFLGLPLPDSSIIVIPPAVDPPQWVLIYGASTSTGTLALQFARLSGFRVVAICSPHNFDLVVSRGAEKAFDYRSSTCAQEVRDHTSDSLQHVFDCISSSASAAICEACISSRGGAIACVLPVKHSRPGIKSKKLSGYTVFGEPFTKFGVHTPAKPEDVTFMRKFFELAQKLLEKRLIKPHPIQLGQGGWEGVLDGIDQLRKGLVSGAKLVYSVE